MESQPERQPESQREHTEQCLTILQSNYIPWKGYFDLINMADVIVFYDDRQYTKNDWRNRNRIKSHQGPQWITIPCGEDANRLICEVTLSDSRWQTKHWKTISQAYGKAPFFSDYREFFEDFYLGKQWRTLSELNQYLVQHIAREFLGIRTRFDDSRNYDLEGVKGERVLDLLLKAKATRYVSGPGARGYIDEDAFTRHGIDITWMDYTGYPEYAQFHPPFVHEVSVLDLLFHTGPTARDFLTST